MNEFFSSSLCVQEPLLQILISESLTCILRWMFCFVVCRIDVTVLIFCFQIWSSSSCFQIKTICHEEYFLFAVSLMFYIMFYNKALLLISVMTCDMLASIMVSNHFWYWSENLQSCLESSGSYVIELLIEFFKLTYKILSFMHLNNYSHGAVYKIEITLELVSYELFPFGWVSLGLPCTISLCIN